MFLWETEFWWFASLQPHRASVWKGDINPCVKARHSTVTAEVDSKANPDSGQCGYLTCYGKDDGWLSLSVRVITVITYITVKKCRKPVERILGNIVGQKNLRKKMDHIPWNSARFWCFAPKRFGRPLTELPKCIGFSIWLTIDNWFSSRVQAASTCTIFSSTIRLLMVLATTS